MAETGQALDGITQGKGFGFVVGSSRTIIASHSYNLLLMVVQDDKSSCPVAVLRSAIELNMDVGTWGKSCSGWEMNRLL